MVGGDDPGSGAAETVPEAAEVVVMADGVVTMVDGGAGNGEMPHPLPRPATRRVAKIPDPLETKGGLRRLAARRKSVAPSAVAVRLRILLGPIRHEPRARGRTEVGGMVGVVVPRGRAAGAFPPLRRTTLAAMTLVRRFRNAPRAVRLL